MAHPVQLVEDVPRAHAYDLEVNSRILCVKTISRAINAFSIVLWAAIQRGQPDRLVNVST